jgi:hypothetical protein
MLEAQDAIQTIIHKHAKKLEEVPCLPSSRLRSRSQAFSQLEVPLRSRRVLQVQSSVQWLMHSSLLGSLKCHNINISSCACPLVALKLSARAHASLDLPLISAPRGFQPQAQAITQGQHQGYHIWQLSQQALRCLLLLLVLFPSAAPARTSQLPRSSRS